VWKLADFGFSSEAHSKSFQASSNSKGTSGYRAPELLQETGGHYNTKVDIWAAGCILYELATNQKAFPSDWAVFQYKTSGIIPDIVLDDAFNDNDKLSIRNSIHAMLQIFPDSRPSSAQLAKEFASNIENLQIGSTPDVRVDRNFQNFQIQAKNPGQGPSTPSPLQKGFPCRFSILTYNRGHGQSIPGQTGSPKGPSCCQFRTPRVN
jgi:serine/threonine protein kinase